jgi:hypothetical protein
MTALTIISEICALRPDAITSRTVRAVQRKIDRRLRDLDLTALSEREQWGVANACSYARGEIGRCLSPQVAAARC